ncbi:hypothetical protein Nepgr_030654 [Nepenthes gracilis]|uniref:Uncharacterized protein n=1 Tax=Nepenthes gracilis TaxID=150966 RepID=A0AAD3TGM2_NEPGR|nr:hypothetical protein Nepgr_030654 [Nepenthes gracilis]
MAENQEPSALEGEQQEGGNESEAIITTTTHDRKTPSGLTQDEFDELKPFVAEFHTYRIHNGRQCSSLLAQLIHAPRDVVWSIVRRFDKPQAYKHFIKSCTVKEGFEITVGCTRDVNVISGLPAETSTERLDILDDDRYVTGFSIIGGEHRLRNYRSVTTLHEVGHQDGSGRKICTVLLESYVVDVPGETRRRIRVCSLILLSS